MSVDGVKNSGRKNGLEFYASWFLDGGWQPDLKVLASYTLKKDVKVASGKRVIDEIAKEMTIKEIKDASKVGYGINSKSLNMLFTNSRFKDDGLFNRVTKTLRDKGYDALEDINDPDTDMPLIMLNSSKILGNATNVKTGEEVIDYLIKKQNKG